MKVNEANMLSFEQIRAELLSLCETGQSGDLRLTTEEKHTAVISIDRGEIVGLLYRIYRGENALKKIRSIKNAKIRFLSGQTSVIKDKVINLPPTLEILTSLGIDLAALQKKILVVEDSTTQRKAIRNMLIQNGYSVIEARDGHEALAILDELTPDLVLLDIVMPGMNGYEVMAAMREYDKMKNVKIIMLTARGTLIDKVYGKVAGSDEYLTKPFNSETLIQAISKYAKASRFLCVNRNGNDSGGNNEDAAKSRACL